MSDIKTYTDKLQSPPSRSNGLFSDFRNFLWNNPRIQTLIKFNSEEKRD